MADRKKNEKDAPAKGAEGKNENAKEGEAEKKAPEPPKKPLTLLQEVVNDLVNWEKAVYLKDGKTCFRLIKNVRRSKKNVKAHHLAVLFETIFTAPAIQLNSFDDFDAAFSEKLEIAPALLSRLQKNPEVEFFVRAMLLVYLVKKARHQEAYNLCESFLRQINELNKRYLDQLRALLYFFYSRLHELKGTLISIRNELFDAYRASCINHDEFGQAVILNLLLRNFLAFSEYEAAQNLLSKTKFPENKFNNEFIRYLYYKGRVRAVQGEYQESFALVQQAIRKAPEKTALGFRLEAQKLACVVELLLGDLPARNIFAAQETKSQLIPYFKLVKGVAVGNLDDFYNVVRQNQAGFIKDRNLNLINRLHQNVIKTGLRRINLSYSKISLHDIAEKLKIHTHHSEKDVEFVVAKAIRDGTMTAHIDHETKSVVMSHHGDVYETQEPQNGFQKRIAYCLHVHTAAVKAHQYPESKIKIASLEDRRSSLDEEELANMLEDMDDL